MDMVLVLVIPVCIIIAMGVLGWSKYRRSSEPQAVKVKKQDDPAAGPVGRDADCAKVVRKLKSFAGDHGFTVIAPARLASGTGVTDFDALLVGSFGILAVKSLGYYGEIYGNAQDKTWVQTTPRHGRIPFASPLEEAAADARRVREILFAAGIKSVMVETACVFPNSGSQLIVPRSTPIYRMKEFSSLLLKDHFTDERNVDIEKVAAALRAAQEK